jgi:hypothetical protein
LLGCLRFVVRMTREVQSSCHSGAPQSGESITTGLSC